jgi:hypothetical protein
MENDHIKDLRILRMMKKVLTDVAKDTHVTPGLKHPLTDNTIRGIQECLALIVTRETEIMEEHNIENKSKPRYVDEPQTSVVVKIDSAKKKDNE